MEARVLQRHAVRDLVLQEVVEVRWPDGRRIALVSNVAFYRILRPSCQ